MVGAVTHGAGLIRVTSMTDGREHAVTIDAMDDAQSIGQLAAVCGALVVPAPLVAPPGRLCPDCVETGHASRRRRQAARHVQPGLWTRVARKTRRT